MDAFEFWVNNLKAVNTRKSYKHYFQRFLKFIGFSADQCVALRRKDLNGGDFQGRLRFEMLTRKYMSMLEECESSYSVRVMSYNAIKSFFDVYGLGLNLNRKDSPKGDTSRNVRAFTKKEVRLLLATSDTWGRALIQVLKSTGLSVSDIARLQVKQLKGDLNGVWRDWLVEENVPLMVKGTRRKTKVKYITFLDMEAVEALTHYWAQRERGTQHLDLQSRGVPPDKLTGESCVFVKKTSLSQTDTTYLSGTVKRMVRKAGLQGLSAHSFRRYFKTTLENPEIGVHPAWVKLMMGHKLSMIERAYSHPRDVELRAAYERAIPFLSMLSRHMDEKRLRTLEEKVIEGESREGEYRKRIERLEAIAESAVDLLRYERQRNKEKEV